MPSSYDVIIVGAGHNGLVAGAYLAEAGLRVLILEKRPVVGGACVTEEIWPGYRVSTAAYVNSLFRPEIVRHLQLAKYGFQMLARNPSSFTPFPDGRYLFLGPDPELNRREIGKFSAADAAAYPRYEAMLDRVARFLEPLLLEAPPDPWSYRLSDWTRWARLAWRFRRLGQDDGRWALRILTAPARTILDDWFESEQLKATLATDAVIGAFASPSTPGTGYVLFHHVMGECEGVRGVWGYVRGGMGALTQALARAAEDRGAHILCQAEVQSIQVSNGQTQGVILADGREYRARCVASGADAHVTFCRLVGRKHLPEPFVQAIERVDYSSASLKINLALAELPDFRALPGRQPGPQHRGTIHICPDLDYMERAYDEARRGVPSTYPILECTLPTVMDETLAPPGKHIMGLFVQYAPYRLAQGSWDDHKEAFVDRCLDVLAQYAPNIRQAILHRQVLSPVDIERTFGLTGGNIFQGAMVPHQLFFQRPVVGWSQYRTPIVGLYLCGSAAHPGGGVIGACGYNAARVILEDRRRWK
ncbi:MAG: amine oxidase [Gemmataceae bacterium]